jgi:oligoribonuclease
MKPTAKYLWMDLETTGLEPIDDRILEVAVIVTDSHLVELTSFQAPLAYRNRIANDFVREMHTKNGLIGACATSPVTETEAQAIIVDLIGDFDWPVGKPILAGSSVHFDRWFLAEWWPKMEKLLHHRHLDATTLKLAMDDAGIARSESESKHRAMADVRQSLDFARAFGSWASAVGGDLVC